MNSLTMISKVRFAEKKNPSILVQITTFFIFQEIQDAFLVMENDIWGFK